MSSPVGPGLPRHQDERTTDEHGRVGRRHPHRLRHLRLRPDGHPGRRRQPAPGPGPTDDRDRPAVGRRGVHRRRLRPAGRGQSGDTAPWSLDREVEDVAALVRAAGAPAALYTSSSGAGVALAAVPAGVEVSALVLYEPPYYSGQDNREHLANLQRLLDEGWNDEAARYNLTAIIGLPVLVVEQMSHAPWWPDMVAVAPTLRYDHQASHDIETDPDWAARWARVTVPTLVLSGDRTFPGLPEAADAVAAALPRAERRVLPGQDHGPAPEAVVPEVVTFLRSVG